MSVNRFASHFMLSPNGELLKWPVVTVDEDGIIESVETSVDGFQERPFIRFFAGVLCPAFVDVYAAFAGAEIAADKSLRNRHFRDGTILMGCGDAGYQKERRSEGFPLVKKIPMPDSFAPIFRKLAGKGTLLERMKGFISPDVSLVEVLSVVTAIAAQSTGLSRLGRIEKGAAPGILLIQNLDLKNKQWTSTSSVRWLSIPAHSLLTNGF